ncbi:hypothetical protein L1987_88883 [Smallanthus sonchifolius]|nr:hypothetical protein L1987_88883 [Smallanthus sonchifolius]
MTSLSLPCSYKKESLLRIESTHIEFSKDLNRCLPSNCFHPVDGEKRYAIEKSASALRQGKQPPDIDLPATSNSHSPSADSDTESYLLERGAEALPRGSLPPLRLMRTRFSRRERSNER